MPFAKDHPRLTAFLSILCVLLVSALLLFGIYWLGSAKDFQHSMTIWMVMTIALFIATNVGFHTYNSLHKSSKLDAALVFSIFWAIAAILAMISTLQWIFPYTADGSVTRQDHAFLSLAAGCVLGWALGMYISPKSSSERSEFARIGAAVAGLASGYTIKGIQTWIFQPANQHYQIYCFLAAFAALLTAATIYNVRAYSLDAVRITFDHADPADSNKVAITVMDTVRFKAAVTGPDDTSVAWTVVPNPIQLDQAGVIIASVYGAITRDGIFSPVLPGGVANAKCRVKAQSVGDPSLSNLVEVSITRA